MPPRDKRHSLGSASSGAHGGQASIRKAYEAFGVTQFYASHGTRYTNPHETQIFNAIAQLLDAIPADVWLGLRELEPHIMSDDEDGNSDDEGYGVGTDAGDNDRNASRAQTMQRDCVHADDKVNHCAPNGNEVTSSWSEDRISSPDALKEKGNRAGSVTGVGDPGVKTAANSGGGLLAGTSTSTVHSGLKGPVPLRILDLACGSGEATAAIMDWNQHHSLRAATDSAMPLPPADVSTPGGTHSHATTGGRQQQAYGRMHYRDLLQAAAGVRPYELHITACDPYTGAAYLHRTGRPALQWSFEDIAGGCLADWDSAEVLKMPSPPHSLAPQRPAGKNHHKQQQQQHPQQRIQHPTGGTAAARRQHFHSSNILENDQPQPPRVLGTVSDAGAGGAASQCDSSSTPQPPGGPQFDLVVCSFALHLCEPSRLHGTCTALSLAARWLAVLAPHKRPVLSPALGWQLAAVWKVERTHLRLYRSLGVLAASMTVGTIDVQK